MSRRDAGRVAGIAPLSPQQKWKAITIGTLVLLPAFWAIAHRARVGRVRRATAASRNPAAFIAFGLALVPFVFLALAFVSEHPAAPMATVKAMGLFLLVGIPVSAIAGDAVTGIGRRLRRRRDRGAAGERGRHVEDAGARSAVRVRRTRSSWRERRARSSCISVPIVPVHEHRHRRPLRRAAASEGAGRGVTIAG